MRKMTIVDFLAPLPVFNKDNDYGHNNADTVDKKAGMVILC